MTVVVSGIGLITPLGEGHPAHWPRFCAGETAIAPLAVADGDRLPITEGARVPAFNVQGYLKDRKMVRLLNPASAFTLAASQLALNDAGLDLATIKPARRALYSQTGMFQVAGSDLAPIVENCCEGGVLSLSKFGSLGLTVINPFLPIRTLPNMGLGAIAIAFDFQGPNLVVGPFANQGAMALDLARAVLLAGDADVCLVAGGDAPFNLMTVSTLLAMGVLPQPGATGLTLGEGGVALVLERLADVRARGGQSYAQVGAVAMAAADEPGNEPLAYVVARASGDEVIPPRPLTPSTAQVGTWPGAGFLLDTAHAALAVGATVSAQVLVQGVDLAKTAAAVVVSAVPEA